MITIARSSETEREVLFGNAANRAGINNPAIVEKDFWVCFTLDYLFHKSPWSKSFVFKGGTSLSKAYNVIERFSEDIDLIMDWRLLGLDLREPWEERSKTQQDKFNKKVVADASEFLTTVFAPQMETDLKIITGHNVVVCMDPDDKEQCTVNFLYPNVFSTAYLRQEIRLEIGPLAEWVPSHPVAISPTAAEQYPQAFNQADTLVPTVDAERTFWEKITILHKTAASYEQKGVPTRYARHYYDIYQMYHSDVKEKAFSRKELLARDVRFKLKFYYAKNASYETAQIGKLKLVPSASAIKELSVDYDHMRDMIYGEKPSFDEIIESISMLEKEINGLA
ncbi:MAG: nucleotidyl transferase AbiEii/AbiGii toxin family protein [Ruminococcus sp.]|nr:nucleotidyl transferase AbiEii/AbiGii toxin family protein [Ruminococcus sp.]